MIGHLVVGAMPFVALAALVAAARTGSANRTWSALAGVLAWALLVVTSTEVLSLTHAIAPGPLAGLWAIAVLLAAVVWRVRAPTAGGASTASTEHGVLASCSAGGIALVLAGTFATAVLAVPNSWDSMTYHLSRVEHWAQNRSLGHYPTNIGRQLYSMPFAEMVMLHARVLSGSDRLANMPAWLAFGGCVWLADSIGMQLGRRRAAGLAAALFAATVPMAVLQASSTLNDLPTAFFLLAAATLIFGRQETVRAPGHAALVGGALGLALLTKGTAYLYAPSLGAAFAIRTRRAGARGAAASLATAAAVAALVNGGHWWRNASRFGTPVVAGETVISAAELGPRSFASNVLRDIAVDLATPSRAVNARVVRTVTAAHRYLGVSPSEPATSFSREPFRVSVRVLYENVASYPLQLLLAIAAVASIVLRRRETGHDLVHYTIAVLAGVAFFTLLVRWQPWLTRLQLPGFLLAAPVVGAAIAEWPRAIAGAVHATLLAGGILALVANETRPLLPVRVGGTLLRVGTAPGRAAADPVWRASRTSQLFASAPERAEPYRRAAAWLAARRADRVGLAVEANSWEYPLWVLLRDARGEAPEIRHVCVGGPAAPAAPWRADAVIVTDRATPDTLRCEGTDYVIVLRDSTLAGYVPVRDATQAAARACPPSYGAPACTEERNASGSTEPLFAWSRAPRHPRIESALSSGGILSRRMDRPGGRVRRAVALVCTAGGQTISGSRRAVQ